MRINVKKLGLAFGLTAVLLYTGCIILMATVGHDATVNFFNNIFHGVDVATIIRMDVPLWEAAFGLVQTFILFWLVGASLGAIYNLLTRKDPERVY